MDRELIEIMDRIVRSQKNGSEIEIQDAMDDLKTYLEPYKEVLFSQSITEESGDEASD